MVICLMLSMIIFGIGIRTSNQSISRRLSSQTPAHPPYQPTGVPPYAPTDGSMQTSTEPPSYESVTTLPYTSPYAPTNRLMQTSTEPPSYESATASPYTPPQYPPMDEPPNESKAGIV